MPAMKSTEEAFEVGQRAYEKIGVTPELAEVMRLYKENQPAQPDPGLVAYESVIDMIETVTMWGLSKSQQQVIERFKAHLIKNIKIMADIVDDPS